MIEYGQLCAGQLLQVAEHQGLQVNHAIVLEKVNLYLESFFYFLFVHYTNETFNGCFL